ncbi:hypothetical protein D9611_011989 [Ephemerocybe angulata]|uniref:F-box domain-containing protein n=1 Tax=Ephemerocybe angulata TaxID=980116 RepID=A0A8H5C3S1_9AGAR|nr:hypothetical protein D9611_011989 [Tulosesus angulatus]
MMMDSPFLKHLDTNYVPTEGEIPIIKAIIQEDKAVLEELEAQIVVLTAARDGRAARIRRHTALLSPIKGLPDDILSTLFLTLLTHPGHRDEWISNAHPAVALSHVCRRWRQLALQTPMLWSSINIYIPSLFQGLPHLPTALDDDFRLGPNLPKIELAARWATRLMQVLRMTRLWIERSHQMGTRWRLHPCFWSYSF